MPGLTWNRALPVVALVTLAACVPRTRSQLVPAPTSANEFYDCVRFQLAQLGFTIVDSDRAGGFVRAQEAFTDWIGEHRTREIYATVMVPPNLERPHLQITSNRHGHDQADAVVDACAPSTA